MYKILLVEDEVMIRKGLKILIQQIIGGFDVTGEASNGKEALDWLKSNVTDMIITDIRMKEMNGIEFIKRVKEQFAELPILIISGYDEFEYAKQALKYNVTDYLLKPIDRLELSQSLEKIKNKLVVGAEEKTESSIKSSNIDENKDEHQIIRRAKEIILQRLNQEISLRYVADQVGFNHQYLSVLFKKQTGQNFSDYVTECRMNKAKQLLKETHFKIYEIAILSGYINTKHFMGMFKQHIGITPSEYRYKTIK